MRKWLLLLSVYALAAALAMSGLGLADPNAHAVGEEQLPPGGAALLGTDALGRDVLSRTVHGALLAFLVGCGAGLLSCALGGVLGLLAGWLPRRFDPLAEWLAGVVSAVPWIVLLLALGHALGAGLGTLVLSVGLASWVGTYRLVRAEVLRLRGLPFLLAARATGAGDLRILARHLLPQVLPILLVQFGLLFAYAVQAEVLLSFLGVGVGVEQPSWGRMIDEARLDLASGIWWPLASAGLACFGLVLAVQRLGDHLRDLLAAGSP